MRCWWTTCVPIHMFAQSVPTWPHKKSPADARAFQSEIMVATATCAAWLQVHHRHIARLTGFNRGQTYIGREEPQRGNGRSHDRAD